MSLKNGVKCGRCDRRYSVLRSKCPYCGARRSKAGKRVGTSDNSTWSLLVGLLILLVLVVAVVVLLVTTLSNAKEEAPPVIDNGPQLPLEDGIDEIEDPNDPDAPPVTPIDPEPDTPNEGDQVGQAITSVKMICFGAELSKSTDPGVNYDISMGVGDVLNISYETTPALEDLDVKWESADPNVVMVLQSGQVTAVGRGTTRIVLTINGAMATCIVRVG